MQPDVDIDPMRVLAIIREENPQAHELAMRRAVIEAQQEALTRLAAAAATTNGHEEVLA